MLNIKLSKLYPTLTAGLLTALGFTWAGIAQADRNDNPIMEDPVIAPGTMVTPSAVQSERTDNPGNPIRCPIRKDRQPYYRNGSFG